MCCDRLVEGLNFVLFLINVELFLQNRLVAFSRVIVVPR